jgi:chloramphenicol-sensitive protein RarD
MSELGKGVWCAVGAYLAWGLMPVYWKALRAVPAPLLLAHRVVWSCLFLALLVLATRRLRSLVEALRRPHALRSFSLAALLISANWLIYVWAVNAGHIVETSLGYFINPLLNVALGVLLLGERLRPLQWAPLALAGGGVAWLAVSQGAPPWIALALALSFGLYGLVKKTSPLGAVAGLTMETVLLMPPALALLLWLETQGQGALGRLGAGRGLLLAAAGPITAVPLLLFAAGARRIPLSLVGLLQYLAPSLQFLIGVAVYHEPFGARQLAGFGLVWTGLLLFAAESLWRTRRPPQPSAAEAASL